MKKQKIFISVVMLLLSCFFTWAQQNVTGKVTDTAGEALQGVAVFVEGTSNGTLTGADGSYSLNVPSNASLVFSMLGYQNLVLPVNGQRVLNAILEEDTSRIQGCIRRS